MAVSMSEAEAYELPELSERSSSPRLYDEGEDQAAESAQLLEAKEVKPIDGDREGDGDSVTRPTRDENFLGKGSYVEALISRVSTILFHLIHYLTGHRRSQLPMTRAFQP